MQTRGFLNYRLKYCWPKVFYCICQPNEFEREIMKKQGGPNRGPSKNLGGPCPPLESPLSMGTKKECIYGKGAPFKGCHRSLGAVAPNCPPVDPPLHVAIRPAGNLDLFTLVRFSLNIKTWCYLGKTRSNLGKRFLHPQNYALPYSYADKYPLRAGFFKTVFGCQNDTLILQ